METFDPKFEFQLWVVKEVDGFALVEVVPASPEHEKMRVILEKVDNVWQARAAAEELSEWKKVIPGLFEEEESKQD